MKLYIDCGSHKGATIKAFLKKYPTGYDIIAIDPTPELFKTYPPCSLTIGKAAWVNDGEIDFYNTKGNKSSAAGTLYRNKKTGKLDKKRPRKVPCIDLSKYISELSGYEYIILKMNIEGAEYPILEKMITDGSILKINELYVKWHWKKIPELKHAHAWLVERLKSIPTLILHEHNIDEQER